MCIYIYISTIRIKKTQATSTCTSWALDAMEPWPTPGRWPFCSARCSKKAPQPWRERDALKGGWWGKLDWRSEVSGFGYDLCVMIDVYVIYGWCLWSLYDGLCISALLMIVNGHGLFLMDCCMEQKQLNVHPHGNIHHTQSKNDIIAGHLNCDVGALRWWDKMQYIRRWDLWHLQF